MSVCRRPEASEDWWRCRSVPQGLQEVDWEGAENRLWLWFSEPSVAAPLSPGGAVHVFHMSERAGWLWFSVLFHGTFHPAPLIYVVTLFLSDFPSVSGLARVCIQGCSRN